MQWDYTRLTSTNVLIGYTRYSSSGPCPCSSEHWGASHPQLLLVESFPSIPVPYKDVNSPDEVCMTIYPHKFAPLGTGSCCSMLSCWAVLAVRS